VGGRIPGKEGKRRKLIGARAQHVPYRGEKKGRSFHIPFICPRERAMQKGRREGRGIKSIPYLQRKKKEEILRHSLFSSVSSR